MLLLLLIVVWKSWNNRFTLVFIYYALFVSSFKNGINKLTILSLFSFLNIFIYLFFIFNYFAMINWNSYDKTFYKHCNICKYFIYDKSIHSGSLSSLFLLKHKKDKKSTIYLLISTKSYTINRFTRFCWSVILKNIYWKSWSKISSRLNFIETSWNKSNLPVELQF